MYLAICSYNSIVGVFRSISLDRQWFRLILKQSIRAIASAFLDPRFEWVRRMLSCSWRLYPILGADSFSGSSNPRNSSRGFARLDSAFQREPSRSPRRYRLIFMFHLQDSFFPVSLFNPCDSSRAFLATATAPDDLAPISCIPDFPSAYEGSSSCPLKIGACACPSLQVQAFLRICDDVV